MVDTEWVDMEDVVVAEAWCLSVLVTGNAALKGAATITLPRTSAVFVVARVVLEPPL